MKVEKQVNEDVARLPKEVNVFKLMNYLDEYNDWAEGKLPKYTLRAGSLRTDQGTAEVLTSHAPSMLDVYATTTVVEASRDPLASASPTEDQSVEACWDSKADPAFGSYFWSC